MHLLGEGSVRSGSPQTGFHMSDREAAIEGRQRAREGAGRVALHHDDLRAGRQGGSNSADRMRQRSRQVRRPGPR